MIHTLAQGFGKGRVKPPHPLDFFRPEEAPSTDRLARRLMAQLHHPSID